MIVEETGFEFSRGTWREVRPRIGDRQQVGLSVRWRPAASAPPTRKRRWLSGPGEPNPAVVHDLSISGARLLVPADGAIVVRKAIDLELDGEWAAVQIAWVQPSEHPSAWWCGVMFLHPGAAFLAAVSRHLGHPDNSVPAPLAWQPDGAPHPPPR